MRTTRTLATLARTPAALCLAGVLAAGGCDTESPPDERTQTAALAAQGMPSAAQSLATISLQDAVVGPTTVQITATQPVSGPKAAPVPGSAITVTAVFDNQVAHLAPLSFSIARTGPGGSYTVSLLGRQQSFTPGQLQQVFGVSDLGATYNVTEAARAMGMFAARHVALLSALAEAARTAPEPPPGQLIDLQGVRAGIFDLLHPRLPVDSYVIPVLGGGGDWDDHCFDKDFECSMGAAEGTTIDYCDWYFVNLFNWGCRPATATVDWTDCCLVHDVDFYCGGDASDYFDANADLVGCVASKIADAHVEGGAGAANKAGELVFWTLYFSGTFLGDLDNAIGSVFGDGGSYDFAQGLYFAWDDGRYGTGNMFARHQDSCLCGGPDPTPLCNAACVVNDCSLPVPDRYRPTAEAWQNDRCDEVSCERVVTMYNDGTASCTTQQCESRGDGFGKVCDDDVLCTATTPKPPECP